MGLRYQILLLTLSHSHSVLSHWMSFGSLAWDRFLYFPEMCTFTSFSFGSNIRITLCYWVVVIIYIGTKIVLYMFMKLAISHFI